MKARSAPTAAIFVALMAAGCAQDGTLTTGGLNTSSIDQSGAQMAKSDPACLTLAAQIEALNRDGTIDKVSKAAAKKYKLKTEDLAKADELNKANSEFQTKCSAYPPHPVVAATTPMTTTTTTPAPSKEAKDATKEKKVAVKKTTTPPVPAAKPPAAATATATPTPTTSTPPPQTAESPEAALPQP